MREILSKSLYSAHLEWGIPEKPIDRIASLRASTALGSALFRWKHGLDRTSRGAAYILALRLASRRLHIAPHHKDFVVLRRAVQQAMVEWHSPNCRDCNGVRVIHVDRQAGLPGVDHTCPTCQGSGVHRYSDRERSHNLAINHLGKWSRRIEEMVHWLAAQEIGVMVGARKELERS
jgi:hypothetical protein